MIFGQKQPQCQLVDKGLTWVFAEQGETALNGLMCIWVCKKNPQNQNNNKLFVRRLPRGPLEDTYQVNV